MFWCDESGLDAWDYLVICWLLWTALFVGIVYFVTS